MALQYIAPFKLIDAQTQYEWRNATDTWKDDNGVIHFSGVEQRRAVETRTYEATIKDTETQIPPVEQNPDNLQSPWLCDGLAYSCDLHEPLTRRIREVWIKQGDWVTVRPINPEPTPATPRYYVSRTVRRDADGNYYDFDATGYGGTPTYENGMGYYMFKVHDYMGNPGWAIAQSIVTDLSNRTRSSQYSMYVYSSADTPPTSGWIGCTVAQA